MVAAEIFTATLSATNIQKGARNVYTSIPPGVVKSLRLFSRATGVGFHAQKLEIKGGINP